MMITESPKEKEPVSSNLSGLPEQTTGSLEEDLEDLDKFPENPYEETNDEEATEGNDETAGQEEDAMTDDNRKETDKKEKYEEELIDERRDSKEPDQHSKQ